MSLYGIIMCLVNTFMLEQFDCILLQYIGRVGVVNTVQDSGDVIVRYSNNKIFLINQLALTKVSLSGQ